MSKTQSHTHGLCGAKTKKGTKCKQPGSGNNGRCRYHGGATPSGPAHYNYKHGRYSKYLKGGIADKYHEAMSEVRLSLLDDIALTDARMAQAMESMGGSVLPELWIKMDGIRQRAEAGTVDRAKALRQIMSIIEQGASDARKWSDVTELQEHKRKLIESENRSTAVAEKSITADEFVYRIRQLVQVIRDTVDDKRTVADLSTAIERTVLGRNPNRASA